MQTSIFPMFFTLERVGNGYILTSRETSMGAAQESAYHKEVVVDSEINERIGKLLRLDCLNKETPVVFHVEAINENTYRTDGTLEQSTEIEANIAYVHFMSKGLNGDSVVALHLKDLHVIEIYGQVALAVAKANNRSVSRSGGKPFLRFPDNKDGMKDLSTCCHRVTLQEATQAEVSNWYEEHKVHQEGIDMAK